jgi:hypothetical protein
LTYCKHMTTQSSTALIIQAAYMTGDVIDMLDLVLQQGFFIGKVHVVSFAVGMEVQLVTLQFLQLIVSCNTPHMGALEFWCISAVIVGIAFRHCVCWNSGLDLRHVQAIRRPVSEE